MSIKVIHTRHSRENNEYKSDSHETLRVTSINVKGSNVNYSPSRPQDCINTD